MEGNMPQLDAADLWAQGLDAMFHVSKPVPESESDFAGLESLQAYTLTFFLVHLAYQQPLLHHTALHFSHLGKHHPYRIYYNFMKNRAGTQMPVLLLCPKSRKASS